MPASTFTLGVSSEVSSAEPNERRKPWESIYEIRTEAPIIDVSYVFKELPLNTYILRVPLGVIPVAVKRVCLPANSKDALRRITIPRPVHPDSLSPRVEEDIERKARIFVN